jgi:hypothetical protein
MPGMITVDIRRTFAAALLMACGPRTKYGTAEQDHTATGLPKWEVQAAVTYLAEPGQRAVSEVIRVTVAATSDPGGDVPIGTPIEFTDLRVGVSSPEAKENGRIRGGTAWWQASGLRGATRQADAKAA